MGRDESVKYASIVGQSLSNMLDNKLIGIDADRNPSGAYPVTSEKREHKVHINDIAARRICRCFLCRRPNVASKHASL